MRAGFICSRDAADGPFLQRMDHFCSEWTISAAVKSTCTAVFQNAQCLNSQIKSVLTHSITQILASGKANTTWIIMGHFPVLKSRFTGPAVAQITSSAHYALCCSQIIFQEERHSLDKFAIPSSTQKIHLMHCPNEWKETAS